MCGPSTACAWAQAINRAAGGHARRSVPTALAARQVDSKLLELAIEVGALQAGFFGHAGHAAAFLRKVKFEVALLERIACHTQRAVEIEALFGLRPVNLTGRRRATRAIDIVGLVRLVGLFIKVDGFVCGFDSSSPDRSDDS